MKKMGIIAGLIGRIAGLIGWVTMAVAAAVSTWDEISRYGITDEDALLMIALTICVFSMMMEKIKKLTKFMRKNFKIRGHKVKELKSNNKEMVA
jgi:hypothetical protein